MAQGLYADGPGQATSARQGLSQSTGVGGTTSLPQGLSKVVCVDDCFMRQNIPTESTAASAVDEFMPGGSTTYVYIEKDLNKLYFSAGTNYITPMQ